MLEGNDEVIVEISNDIKIGTLDKILFSVFSNL
jgi:hypothetical protein